MSSQTVFGSRPRAPQEDYRECRVIRNPSVLLQHVNGPRSLHLNNPRGRITSVGLKLDRALRKELWEWKVEKKNRSYVLLFIGSAVDISELFQLGGVLPVRAAGIRGMTGSLHKNLKQPFCTEPFDNLSAVGFFVLHGSI